MTENKVTCQVCGIVMAASLVVGHIAELHPEFTGAGVIETARPVEGPGEHSHDHRGPQPRAVQVEAYVTSSASVSVAWPGFRITYPK